VARASFGGATLEIAQVEHEIEFDAIRLIVVEDLAHDGKFALRHLGVHPVVTPEIPTLFADADVGATFFFQQPAAFIPRWGDILQFETGDDADPKLATTIDVGAQLVSIQALTGLDHTQDSPIDVGVPRLLALSHDAPHLAAVEIDIAVPQAKHEGVHAGAGDFLHRPLQHMQARRRFESFGVKVMAVVVVDEARCIHAVTLL